MVYLEVKGSTNETGGGVIDLPLDIVFDILLRLPVELLIEYKRVSKTWYGIIKDPRFIELHLHRSKCKEHPRCVLTNGGPGIFSIYYLINERENKWRAIEETLPKWMLLGLDNFGSASCNGLLCLSACDASSYPIFITNIITREWVKIPGSIDPVTIRDPLTGKEQVVGDYEQSIGFGYDPISKNYKLVRTYFVYIYEGLCLAGEIMTLGECSWRRLEFPHFIREGILATPFLNGSFYWIIDNTWGISCLDNILAFDIHDEKFRTIKFPHSKEIEIGMDDSILMNLGGLLSLGYRTAVDNICIWQMQDNKWSCQYTIMINGDLLFGINIYDNILLEVIMNDTLQVENFIRFNHFLYDTTKRQAFDIEISDYPSTEDQMISIVPSLVSPEAVLAGFSIK